MNCKCLDTAIINTRTNSSANRGYAWIPDGIRVRQRKCKKCGNVFTTYEGTLDNLISGFKRDIIQKLRK